MNINYKAFFLMTVVGALLGSFLLFGFKSPPSNYPPGFIPMFASQESGEVSGLININSVEEIIAVKRNDRVEPNLVIHGKVYVIEEPFEEFVARAAKSFKK